MTGPDKPAQFQSDQIRAPGACRAEFSVPGLRVLSFESRLRDEMRSLISRHGGIAKVVPSMREISLEEQTEPLRFADELFAGRIDVVVFLTGVGARYLLEALERRFERSAIVRALHGCLIIVRGPKPAAVLQEWGVRIDHRAESPNTWREVLAIFDAGVGVSGKSVAVQEYGRASVELYHELERRGARVLPVPVYRWALPEDVALLAEAIQDTIAGRFDVLIFTSANQITNVLSVAQSRGLADDFIRAARHCAIASVGPTSSEAIQAAGLCVDVEAEPTKMGPLVRQALTRAAEVLSSKRSICMNHPSPRGDSIP